MLPMHRRLALGAAFVALHCVPLAVQAGALSQTFVSAAIGSDQNPCTSELPCRTLAAAVAVTEAGGLVVAVDSGVFSEKPLELSHSITIAAAPGVEAVLQADTWSVVVVNAGPSDAITLRGFTLMPAPGSAAWGIQYSSGGELSIEDCRLLGFKWVGVYTLGTNQGRLLVRHSLVRSSNVAFYLCSPVLGVFDDVTISDANFGLVAEFGATASVRDSALVGNNVAIRQEWDGELTIEDCLLEHNGTAVDYWGPGVVRLAGSTITDNNTGVYVGSGGIIETRGDNTIRGNGRDVVGVMTAIPGL